MRSIQTKFRVIMGSMVSLVSVLSFTTCSQSKESLPSPDLTSRTASVPQGTTARYFAKDLSDIGTVAGLDTAEISSLCDAALKHADDQFNAIVAIPADKRSFENTVLAQEEVSADLADATSPLIFMAYVSTDAEKRDAGSTCEEKVGQFWVSVVTRKDLYDAIKDQTGRTDEEKRLLSETLKAFEKNGLKLSEAQLARVRELKKKLSSLESDFSSNLNEDASKVIYSAEELEGVPADFLSRLARDASGKYIATTKSTDYTQVMQNAKHADARKKMIAAYYGRAGDANTKLLEEAIVLRQQIARELGYATWADARTDGRMAKNAATVLNFLGGLKDKLKIRNKSDLDQLLKMKKLDEPSTRAIEIWDIPYYSYQLKKRDYNLDNSKIREFFPAHVVMKGLFDVYSTLLGVRYEEVTDAKVWADHVKKYKVIDQASGKLVAYFYTDLVPRQGKYGHAAAFPLILGRGQGESYSVPVASIVANFTPPSQGKPSLMDHDEVETMFHEFGHIMHQTLTRAPYASLAGSSVAQDFVEAPSQMLEGWVWDTKILEKISGHYLDESKKLPKELLNQMIAAKDFNQGYLYTRQLYLGLMDLAFHTAQGPVDTSVVGDALYREIIGVEPLAGGRFQAGFGHLMGGYDAGYYGYLWSEVYAADMFTRFENGGLLNASIGADYRKFILEPGNMVDPLELVTQFLGRAPNSDAFYKRLGL